MRWERSASYPEAAPVCLSAFRSIGNPPLRRRIPPVQSVEFLLALLLGVDFRRAHGESRGNDGCRAEQRQYRKFVRRRTAVEY